MKKLIYILLLLFPYYFFAQNTFIAKRINGVQTHEIYQINLTPDTSATLQFEFEPNGSCVDIAISPNGKFYGVGTDDLYEINENNGTTTFLHAVPTTGINNTLVCSNDNNLYVLNTGGFLYKYDLINETFEEVIQIQDSSPGDITFYKGNLIFQSAMDGNIKALNLADLSLVTIYCMDYPVNAVEQSFFGLSNNSSICESLSLIASSTANDLYEIDIANDTIKHLKLINPFLDLKTLIVGTASTNEHFSSTCSFQFTNVDCTPSIDPLFFILGKTQTDNLYHIYSLNPDQTLTFQYEFYSEFGCNDIAFTESGILYGIGTDSPVTLFKINPISHTTQELIKYPVNKTLESIVFGDPGSIYSIDQDGFVYSYHIICNEMNPFLDPIDHIPTSDLAFKNQNLIFQSKNDGNIKAFNISGSEVVNIFCVPPPYNNTSTGGFIGMANYFMDCSSNSFSAFNAQNLIFEINLDTDTITQTSLSFSGLGANVTIQGTAYNNICALDSEAFFTNILCTSALEKITKNINIKLFPNPVKDVLTITSDAKIQHIKIYDIYGRIWKNFEYLTSNISTEELSQGVYFLEIHTDRGNMIKKIIKE